MGRVTERAADSHGSRRLLVDRAPRGGDRTACVLHIVGEVVRGGDGRRAGIDNNAGRGGHFNPGGPAGGKGGEGRPGGGGGPREIGNSRGGGGAGWPPPRGAGPG